MAEVTEVREVVRLTNKDIFNNVAFIILSGIILKFDIAA